MSDEQINRDMNAMFGAAERAEKKREDRIAELEKQLAELTVLLSDCARRLHFDEIADALANAKPEPWTDDAMPVLRKMLNEEWKKNPHLKYEGETTD